MTVETAKEAQRLLRLVAKLQKDATQASARDIDVLCALGFQIQSEQVYPEPRTYWLDVEAKDGHRQFVRAEKELWAAENDSNQRALAMLQEMAAAVEQPKVKRPMKNTLPATSRDATDLSGATLQVKNSDGDIIFKMTQGHRIFFNGKDGSVIRVGVDQDGNLRLWVDEQLVILPVSTNTAKVVEQKVCLF